MAATDNSGADMQPFARLADFAGDVHLDAEGFERRHASALLVHPGVQMSEDEEETTTMIRTTDVKALLEAESAASASEYSGGSLVFLVKNTGRSVTSAFISIGRTRNNDVVLTEDSVSGFHAMVREEPDGGFSLQDADSTNGSYVDGVPAPGRDAPAGTRLEPGVRLRFGAVELTYFDVATFIELVREVTGR